MCAAVHFQKMLCADFSCARKDSLGQFHKLHETYSFRLDFSYQSWFFSNFKTSTSKLISHQGNFDIFFLTKEEDDAFRLIFRFWATLLLLRPLMTQRSLCGNFTFLSIFRGSWPPYSFLASILSSAECQIKLSPFSLMHSYLIRTLAKKPDKYQLCPLY